MSISKEVIKQCLISKQREVDEAVERRDRLTFPFFDLKVRSVALQSGRRAKPSL